MHTRRATIALLAGAGLAGCGARGRLGVAARPANDGRTQTLLVATTRSADPVPLAYGPDRAKTLDAARLVVSIPPGHRVGAIEWPPGPMPDPARHFALIGAQMLDGADAIVRAAATHARAGGDAEAVLFVHGYNNTFAEGVYRHAQIAWDYGLEGPQIHFAWASAGHPLGYAYDRDSALVARDALADLILRLLADGRTRLTVAGHSMGWFLVMEALRQIALMGRRAMLDRLAGVALISPDIDLDLFLAQAAILSPLPQPFAVAVARNDRLLGLSSRLARGGTRLGSVADLERLGDLGLYVIDLTGLRGGNGNHFLPGTSPAAIALMRGLRGAGDAPVPDIGLGPVRITLGLDGLQIAGR
ncbi:alpha/beta hydrolase [uncultured Jannaschia sp.]|uniref:alpha/beta hydrolase n=1 Tax=uncultured Jannaschia sp. TaxID=293347 RepID=UPI00261BA056|nr:alpha/beta hydrolase [uncultured Jannaschia sp.]